MIRILPTVLLSLLVLLAPGQASVALAAPAAHEAGVPFLSNHTPREYGSFFQTWAVAQDGQGLIYVGNNLGVLQYVGARWRLIKTGRQKLVRALATDARGRVYVGTQGELGYLEGGPGQARFMPLTDRLAPEDRAFTDVKTIIAVGQDIYFQSAERLFRWRDGRFTRWLPTQAFLGAFTVGGCLFVTEAASGLLELKNDQLEPLAGGAPLRRDQVAAVLPLDPARTGDGDLLVATRDHGFFRLGPTGPEPIFAALKPHLASDQISACAWLRDGTLAVGTRNRGLLRLDQTGQIIGHLNKRDGLQDDAVKGLFQDAQGGLWLPLQRGVSRVEWPSPLSRFEEPQGLDGLALSQVRFRGALWAGTDRGVFRLGVDAEGCAAMHPVFRACGGVWGFLPWDDDLIMAASEGVWVMAGDQFRQIYSGSTAFTLLRSRQDPAVLYVGLRNGLLRLRKTRTGWVDEGQDPDLLVQVRSLVEMEDGRLWLGTAADGALRLRIAPGPRLQAAAVERFGVAQGLPGLSHDYVYAFHDGLEASSHAGLFRFDPARDRFEPDPRMAGLFPEGPRWVYAPVEDAQGRIWMHTCDEARNRNESGVAVPEPDGGYRWQGLPFLRFSGAWVESLLAEPDGCVWFSTWEGIIRYEPESQPPPSPSLRALIREAQAGNPGGAARPVDARPIAHRDNRLRFEFAAPIFGMEWATRYQVLLEGWDSQWSEPSLEPYREYGNLPGGSYRFRVRALDGFGRLSAEAEQPFRVLSPWYRTWWARLLQAALGGGLLALYIRLRTSALKARNAVLAARVEERTLDLGARNRELEALDTTVKAINREVALQPLLEVLLQQSQALFPQAETAAVLLRDDQDRLFRVQATLCYPPGLLDGVAFTEAEMVARYTDGTERLDQGVFRVTDLTHAAGSQHMGDLPLPCSLLAMSLEVNDTLAGFLVLESHSNPEAFRSADADKLLRFREHATNALGKASMVERLETAAAQLRDMDNLKTQFLGIVAHDLRNPLNGIILSAELQGEIDDLEEIRRLSGQIRTEGQDMSTLISRFLDVAAIESGSIQAEQNPIDLVPLIRHILDRFATRAAGKRIALRFDPPQAWMLALGDERFVKEVLDNLLSNALKFSPPDRTVTIRLEPLEAGIRVSVEDQGPGLTADDRLRLFNRFTMLSARPTGGEKSTGLGLSIVKHMVEAMGGRVWVDSETGCGAAFRFELPLP